MNANEKQISEKSGIIFKIYQIYRITFWTRAISRHDLMNDRARRYAVKNQLKGL
jgi:hypothetical protein